MPLPESAALPALSERAALFLDFDGSLVEIAGRPDAVQVDDGLIRLLRQLIWRHDRAVAIVSGRPVAELQRFLPLPGLSLAGVHGAEILLPGETRIRHLAPPLPASVLNDLRAACAKLDGVLLETKRFAAAVHYRNAPHHTDACRRLARELGAAHGLEVLSGKTVVELRQPGLNKGRALRQLVQEPAFAGRLPIAVGDDRTDIDAFRAAKHLGGYAVGIGAGFGVADHVLDDPVALRRWLGNSIAGVSGAPSPMVLVA